MMNARSLVIPEGEVVRILMGDQVLWKTKKILTTTDMPVKDTGAELIENWNLTPNSFNGQANANYFTFKYIPVEPGVTYYSQYGTRSWYYDSEKNAVKTLNLSSKSGTGSTVQYQFVVPDGVKYISISYSYAVALSGDNVFICRVK